MLIDALINDAVRAYNRNHPAIIISKSYIARRSWYFLYLEGYDIWGIEESFLYKFLYERLSKERIYPTLQSREIKGVRRIGIAFEVKT